MQKIVSECNIMLPVYPFISTGSSLFTVTGHSSFNFVQVLEYNLDWLEIKVAVALILTT